MGVVDWIILVILVVSLIYGFRKGLLGMLIRLAGIVLCFVLISHFYPAVSQKLIQSYKLSSTYASIAASTLIFVSVAIVIKLFTVFVNRTLTYFHLGFINRFIGALFGFLCSLGLILTVMVFWDFTSSRWEVGKQKIGFVSPTALGSFPNLNGPVVDKVKVIKQDLMLRTKLAGFYASPFYSTQPKEEKEEPSPI
ncbi:MAG: CvpA family protein [Candidatus Cloacimonetes bacterium]|nr:CvpA family protein [Candidatus Cloacimonadota bacterium]